MTDLKAKNKGKKPNENMVSLQSVQAQGGQDGQEQKETVAERSAREEVDVTMGKRTSRDLHEHSEGK